MTDDQRLMTRIGKLTTDSQPPRRQDRQEGLKVLAFHSLLRPFHTLFLGGLGVLADGFSWLTFQVVVEGMLREQKFYLAGEWRASEVHTVIKSPYDGRELAKVSLATEQDVDEATEQAVRAFAVTRKLSSHE